MTDRAAVERDRQRVHRAAERLTPKTAFDLVKPKGTEAELAVLDEARRRGAPVDLLRQHENIVSNIDAGPGPRSRAVARDQIRRSERAIRPVNTYSKEDRDFSTYLRGGRPSAAMERAQEHRDLTEASNSGGGYTVPPAWNDALMANLTYASAFYAFSTIWDSETGAAGYLPIIDDTAQTAGAQPEDTIQTETDLGGVSRVTFGITPLLVARNLIRLGRGLLADAGFDVDGTVAAAFAARIARSTDPTFLATLLAGITNTTTTASNSALAYNDLAAFFHSLDFAYRYAPTTAWIVHPTTALRIREISDTQTRPIFLDTHDTIGVNDNGPVGTGRVLQVPLLFGRPVLESKSVAQFAAGATIAVLADFSKAFVIRWAQRPSVLTLYERFADFGEIGFSGWCRVDGQVALPAAAAALVVHA